MNCLDLCAGAGGLSLGLQRAGFSVTGVELDPDAVLTHSTNVGPCVHADIMRWEPPHPVDLVAAGVPCQPFSQAGERSALEHDHGTLFGHVLRVAHAADAWVVLFENVKALLYRRGVLEAFHAGCRRWGFTCLEHRVLDAAEFGLPQHRRRVFLVASRVPLGLRWPKPTHGDGLRPLVTVRDTLGLPLDRPSVTVTATENRACNVSGSRGGDLQVAVGVRGARRAGDLLKPMLRARGEVYEPRHAALLQGFPPDFQFHGARSSVWRQIGNAVPPPLGEIVGRMILEAIE